MHIILGVQSDVETMWINPSNCLGTFYAIVSVDSFDCKNDLLRMFWRCSRTLDDF